MGGKFDVTQFRILSQLQKKVKEKHRNQQRSNLNKKMNNALWQCRAKTRSAKVLYRYVRDCALSARRDAFCAMSLEVTAQVLMYAAFVW